MWLFFLRVQISASRLQTTWKSTRRFQPTVYGLNISNRSWTRYSHFEPAGALPGCSDMEAKTRMRRDPILLLAAAILQGVARREAKHLSPVWGRFDKTWGLQ